METTNNVTFIITNRDGKNIDFVINNFKSTFSVYFDDIFFIVVEQSNNLPFKRGQLYNIGVKYCKTEWIGLIDNDIVNITSFNPIKVYEDFGDKPFIAFDKIVQCEVRDSKIKEIEKPVKRLYGFGAFNFMKKNDFINCNGFSNLCFGWGAEDDILNLRIKFKRLEHKIGHIKHKKRVNDNPKSTENNKRILKSCELGKIQADKDGYEQTEYNLVYEKNEDNILYIGVDNISVKQDYSYINEYINAENISENRTIISKQPEKPIVLTKNVVRKNKASIARTFRENRHSGGFIW